MVRCLPRPTIGVANGIYVDANAFRIDANTVDSPDAGTDPSGGNAAFDGPSLTCPATIPNFLNTARS